MSEFRSAARESAGTIMSAMIPSLTSIVTGKREQNETLASRSSDRLNASYSDVTDTAAAINYNLENVNNNVKKMIGAMDGVATAVGKQNLSITKGFGVVAGAVTALLAAAGLSVLSASDEGKYKPPVEPQTGLGTTFDSPFPWQQLSGEGTPPLENLVTPAVMTDQTRMAPPVQSQPVESSIPPAQRDAAAPQASQTESGFYIPGTAIGTSGSAAAAITPAAVTGSSSARVTPQQGVVESRSTSGLGPSMYEMRESMSSGLPKSLEITADDITFSAGRIVMKDRSRENRVSREIEALREKGQIQETGAEEQQTVEQPSAPEPRMGLTTPYGSGAGSAGGVGSVPDALKTGENGRLRDDQLADIGIGGHKAHPKAAEAFKAMRAAAAAEGVNLGVTGAYRTYERQEQLRREKGGMAAVPGRSNHGWGLAFDMDFGSNMNSAGFMWMSKNASRFGIQGPLQSPFEPWHWEYRGGEDVKAMEGAKQQTGAVGGMGEGVSPMAGATTSVGSMMPGQTNQPMMLPPSAGGGAPAMMMPPSVSTGTTLNRESVAPTLNSPRSVTPVQVGNPSPTSNQLLDASSKNPRIADPSIVGSISPEFDRLRKVFSGWGSFLSPAPAGR